MEQTEVVSLALTGLFGLVSTIGVAYQVIDIRQKGKKPEADPPPSPGFPGHAPPASLHPSAGQATHQSNIAWGPGGQPAKTSFAGSAPSSAPPVSPAHPGSAPPYQVSPAHPGSAPPYQVSPAHPVSPYQVSPSPHSTEPPTVTWQPHPTPTAPGGMPHQPVAHPQPPYAGPYAPPTKPATPRIVLRIQVLLLLLTVLLVPAVISFSYAVAEDPTISSDPTSELSFVGYTVAYLVFSIPLAALPPILSRAIGRGRNWARITAVVVLLMQGLFCGCFGIGAPLQIADSQAPGLTVAYIVVGVLSFAFALVSFLVSIMLLMPKSNMFFQSMERWRLTTGAK